IVRPTRSPKATMFPYTTLFRSPGGRIQLRRNEFEVQRGEIRFTDATAIVPEVDVSAVTEYQRYSSSGLAQTAPNAGGDSARLGRSEEHTSELQSRENLVCRLLL